MMMAAFAPDSALDTISDFGALVVTLAAVAGIVWTAVVRAMKPLRERLDAIHDLTVSMAQERERVDDLSDKTAEIDRRLGVIERRVEDLYHLLVSIIDPRRLRNSPDDDAPTG